MVYFVIGRTKTGKSTYCLEQFANKVVDVSDRRPSYFVVPEQYALVTERKLLHLDVMKDRTLLQDEVISFKRLSHRILSRLGGLVQTHLDDAGSIMLLTQIAYNHLNDLLYYKDLHTQSWQLNRIRSLFSEFEKYAVGPTTLQEIAGKEDLQGSFKDKIHDLQILYQSYEDCFNAIGLTEGALFHLALQKAKTQGYFDHTSVWIDSFTGFTKLEREFILLLMQQCAQLTITLTLDDEPIFDSIHTTFQGLVRLCREQQIPYETIVLNEDEVGYYQGSDLQFLERAYTKFHAQPYPAVPENVRIMENGNLFEEITSVAQSILQRNKEGVPFGKIAVSTRHPEEYRPLIEAVFSHYQIPYFIDARRNIQSNPLVLSILSMLRMFYRNFRQEDVLTFMKAGLYFEYPGDQDGVENEILAKNIQGFSRFSRSEHPELIRFTEIFKPTLERCKNINRIDQFVDILSACICTLEFPDKLEKQGETFLSSGNIELGTSYKRIWDQVQSFFAQIKLFLGSVAVNSVSEGWETLYRLLSVCASTYQSGFLPQNPDAVQITSVDRSRVADIDSLYLIGAVEGAFPASFDDSGLLNDQERAWLLEHAVELADDSLTKTSKERFLIYATLFSPAAKLYISYSLRDFSGNSCMPASAVVGQIQRLFPKLALSKPECPVSANQVPTSEAFLAPNLSKALFLPQEIPLISVSKLETYRSCPFQYFLTYGLQAKKREVAELEFADIGDLMHKLVEKGTALIIDTDAHSDGIIEQIFPEAFSSVQITPEAVDSGRGKIAVVRLKKFAISTLDGIRKQLRTGSFVPVGFEVPFGKSAPDSLPPLIVQIGDEQVPAIRLQGQIDRFDACVEEHQTYIRVVDYKSSMQSIQTEDVYHGRRLQLITYMKALIQQQNSREQLAKMLNVPKDHPFLPAGVLYFTMKDDFDRIDVKGQYQQHSYCMEGFVLNDGEVLDRMIGDDTVDVIAYSRKNDGTYKNKKNWISFKEYTDMAEAVDNAVRISVGEIASGKIAPCPKATHSGKAPCAYCVFGAVCGTVLKQ